MENKDSLKSLHTSLIDAEKGYETAIADAELPDVKTTFRDMAALHSRAHADVHRLLSAAGERPDESGSFMAVVHKTVISVRSAVAGLDRASFTAFADGEERILNAYDKAIADAAPAETEILARHRQALAAAIADLRAKAA